jgi:hypothetical protein
MAADEGNVDANDRALIYRFEIQHFTPREAFGAPGSPRDVLLKRAGITVDMRGNKVSLLADGPLIDRLCNNPEIMEKLSEAGWALQHGKPRQFLIQPLHWAIWPWLLASRPCTCSGLTP